MKKLYSIFCTVLILILVNSSNLLAGGIPIKSKTAIFDFSIVSETNILKSGVNVTERVVTSEIIKADIPFSDVGVHWTAQYPPESDILIETRTSKDNEFWTGWNRVFIESYPDENPKKEFFSYLIGIEQKDRTHEYIQYRVTLLPNEKKENPLVEKISFTFIDAGITPPNLLDNIKNQQKIITTQYFSQSISSSSIYPKPTVVSRAGWGANESWMTWPPQYESVTHNIIHHTDTPNTDTDWAARIRSIYYYHAVTLGWGDIGYNYLVDLNGVLYEGRYGGDEVIGAHALGYNDGSMGLASLGSYGGGTYGGNTTPSAAMLTSAERLLAWKCSQRNIDPLGSGPDNDGAVYPYISGHRDVASTICPGNNLYALLPTIRTNVKNLIGGNRPPAAPTNVEPANGATGVSLTPTLRGSAFSDPDPGDYHWKTWWDIRRVSDSVVVWDSDWRTFDLTSTVVPAGKLNYNTSYKWRVRYMDNKGAWSEPLPVATTFTTQVAPDTTPPTISAFSVTPLSLTLGNSFTISYTVSDTGGSGLNRVELWRANDSGGSPVGWAEIKRTTVSGNGPVSGSFSDAPSVTGSYWYGAHVVDNAGNWNDEKNSNTGGLPGVYGPIKVTVNPPPTISVTPASRDFGSVQVGSYSDLTFTVQNAGGGTLTGSASVPSPFTIFSGGSYSLTAGQSQVVTVRFSPTAAQSYSQNVSFTGGGGATRPVSGTGYSPPVSYTLTVNSSGASSVSIGSSTGHDGITPYNKTVLAGTSVNLQSPQYVGSGASRMSFTGWSGSVTSSDQSITFTMNGTKTVTANYVSDTEPVLSPMTVDLNNDGIPNFYDFSFFAMFWLDTSCSSPSWCEGRDFNHDGAVGIDDLQIFAEFWLWPVADVDMDGAVNFTDYAIFAYNWMDDTCCDPNWCEGTDFDHSGSVDMLDLATFARYWLEGI